MYQITKWFGTFLIENGKVKKYTLFENDKNSLHKKLKKMQENQILNEEKKLSKGFKVKVFEKRLEKIGEYNKNQENLDLLINPEDFGFSEETLNEISTDYAKEKLKIRLSSEDLQIIQMVNALDDLIQTSNLLSERIAIWQQLPSSKNKIRHFEQLFENVKKEIKNLESQIEGDMQKIAPNIRNVAGSLIGARLISIAGGLEKLALMPSSTVQILGAEKALFRYKKEGGKPPKHGVIFQHHLIKKASKSSRGKIARKLAAKISIASKADAFTKRDITSFLN